MNKKSHKISKYAPSIFQGRLNLAVVSTPHMALSVEYPVERVIWRVVLVALGLIALCYLYFVSASVLNIMARKEALASSGRIEASIGTLEGEYFTLSQAITPQSAGELGLIEIKDTQYVDRPGNVGLVETDARKQI